MYIKKTEEDLECGIRVASLVFGGKWKCCILDAIHRGIVRPADICKYISDASPRVIEIQLAELLFHGAIEKFTDEGYPKKTEYRLTPLGSSTLPVLALMDQWGSIHSNMIKKKSGSIRVSV